MTPVLLAAVRVALVLGGLVLLAFQAGAHPVSSALRDPWALAAGLAVNQLSLALFAVRMRAVLALAGIRIGLLDAFRIHLQSMFYFFVVPMTVGLELARFLKVRTVASAADPVRLGGALLFDRLIGAGSALMLAIATLPFLALPHVLAGPAWAVGAGAVVLAALAALAVPSVRRVAVRAMGFAIARPGGAVVVLLLSVAVNVATAFGILLAAAAFGVSMDMFEAVLALCGGVALMVLPVSFGGFGPADAGAAGLLVLVGHTTASAVLVAALIFSARLVAGIQGGVWEMVDGGVAAFGSLRWRADTAPGP